MAKSVLASDRVLLLLSLVPYLREHGPTQVSELARVFDVSPALLRRLVTFLATAGIPGETLSYQHDDLFDIDWDAFEEDDVVSLTHTVAIEETPRFTGTETAALLAGLHALRPMLAPDDRELAERLAARLGEAMQAARSNALSVADAEADERLPLLVSAIERRRTLRIRYRDAEGRESLRTIDPLELVERAGVWYLRAFSHERAAERTFTVAQLSEPEELGAFAEQGRGVDPALAEHSGATGIAGAADAADAPASDAPDAPASEIVAIAPVRLLPVLRGFDPEVLAELPGDRVRIRIEAWHPKAAVRLVQHGPGEIEIVSPHSARAAVSEWAEAALSALGA